MSTPTIIVEIAFPVTPSGSSYLYFDDTARGKFDTGQFAPDNSWQDVTADVRSVVTSRGRQRQMERYRAGTATIVLDNRSGAYDPNNLSGPYVSGGVTQVVPMRRIRVRATWLGVTYDVFSGFADSWDVGYNHNFDSTTTVQATDGFKVLGRFDGTAGSSVGAGEDSGARVTRVLNNAGWPNSDRDIDVGDSTLQATTLADNALTELFLVADSEFGAVYMGPDNKVVFDRRHAVFADTRCNTSNGTFTDNPAGTLPYVDIVPKFDDELVKNTISIARVGGTAKTASDGSSQGKYLFATFQRTDLIFQTDSESQDYANFMLHVFKEAEQRVEQITLRPFMNDNLWPHALGRLLRDRITISRTPMAGDVLSKDCFIEGISHSITDGGTNWETRWDLSLATQYGSFLVFDHPTLGKLDSNALAY